MIEIMRGALAVDAEEAAARKRRELREKLLRGEKLKVNPTGTLADVQTASPNAIVVPEGKLAGIYWYERDPELLADEKAAVASFFPQFSLGKLDDGRLYWHGEMQTDLRPDGVWHLQAVYENNHPSNDNWGGSVKIYSILPDLEEIYDELGAIPHTLRDSARHLYLCTARMEDVRVGSLVTSAASSLAWAAKWIGAFELWMAGDLTTERFSSHL
jgi:hypothetical protein